MSQAVVSIDQCSIRRNVKNSPTCTFCCQSGHRIDNCTERKHFQLNGCREYLISDEFQNGDLRKRIENDMPIAPLPPDQNNCISTLSPKMAKSHFIIHEAYQKYQCSQQYSQLEINHMLFNVSFISKNGQVDKLHEAIIIAGKCIDTMLAQASTLKTVKRFVYDETPSYLHRPHWHIRRKPTPFPHNPYHLSQANLYALEGEGLTKRA